MHRPRKMVMTNEMNNSSVSPVELASETAADKLREITDKLERGVEEYFHSDKYKELLRVLSEFHSYSVNNLILIAMQKPDASYVAGYTTWKNKFGRNVKKGERGIKLTLPTAKAGGFLLRRPCPLARVLHSLHKRWVRACPALPWVLCYAKSRSPSFSMFFAAFTSRL